MNIVFHSSSMLQLASKSLLLQLNFYAVAYTKPVNLHC